MSGPWRFGEMSSQGKRSDLLTLRDKVKLGKRGAELYDDDEVAAAAIRYGRGVDAMARAYSKALPRPTIEVCLHFGPPGTGKTHCAHEDGCYMLKTANGFWLGYKGEEHVVLDEFGGHVMSPLDLQTLCDVYPYMVNIKGNDVPGNIVKVDICSNYLPDQWWKAGTHFKSQAIYRRIHSVHWHYEYKKFKLYKSDPLPDVLAGNGEFAMDKFLKAYNEANFVPINH